jgi:hypothetical protein
MRKSTKILVALVAAGTVGAAGSAFTATSTIDDPAINVGSVVQSVSGATITNVSHSYNAATDTTTAISAKAEQLLSTSAGVVKIGINSEALQDCTVTLTDVEPLGTDEGVGDFSTITCDIADTADVTSVRFVVNG